MMMMMMMSSVMSFASVVYFTAQTVPGVNRVEWYGNSLIGKDLEGNCLALVEVLTHHSPESQPDASEINKMIWPCTPIPVFLPGTLSLLLVGWD
jgi:hypothetical protein